MEGSGGGLVSHGTGHWNIVNINRPIAIPGSVVGGSTRMARIENGSV